MQPTTRVTPFSMAENPHFSPSSTTAPGVLENGMQEGRSTAAGTSRCDYGAEYITCCGTSAEKSGLHSSTVSHFHSRSLGDSPTGLIRDPTQSSPPYVYNGSASVAVAHDQYTGPSYMRALQTEQDIRTHSITFRHHPKATGLVHFIMPSRRKHHPPTKEHLTRMGQTA